MHSKPEWITVGNRKTKDGERSESHIEVLIVGDQKVVCTDGKPNPYITLVKSE